MQKIMKLGGMFAAVFFAANTLAFAISTEPDTKTETEAKPKVECKEGEVLDQKTGKCEKKEAVNDQDSLFIAGRDLAYAGKFEAAIEMLNLAPVQDDKQILNMLGYSNRKLGRLDVAVAYYKHSIAVDPTFPLVREYYGEALLERDDLGAAIAQLDTIRSLCGEECRSYTQLFAAIENFKSGKPDVTNRATW